MADSAKSCGQTVGVAIDSAGPSYPFHPISMIAYVKLPSSKFPEKSHRAETLLLPGAVKLISSAKQRPGNGTLGPTPIPHWSTFATVLGLPSGRNSADNAQGPD
jgi:hypothetical protein